jgi:hypothetical protein
LWFTVTISKQLVFALKTSDRPLYFWAQQAGFARPESLSRILWGARRISERDLLRLQKLGEALGVKRVVTVRGARHAKADAATSTTRSTQHDEGRVMAGASQGSGPTA